MEKKSLTNIQELDLLVLSFLSFKDNIIYKLLNKYFYNLITKVKYDQSFKTSFVEKIKLNIEYYKILNNFALYDLSTTILKNIELMKIDIILGKLISKKIDQKIIIFFQYNETINKLDEIINKKKDVSFINLNRIEGKSFITEINKKICTYLLVPNSYFLKNILHRVRPKSINNFEHNILIFDEEKQALSEMFEKIRKEEKFNKLLIKFAIG